MVELGLRRLLVRNTGVQVAAQIVSLAIGLATSVVLSRYLGVRGFGEFNYIFAFYYFFLTINDFGVNTVVVREASRQRERAGEIIGAMLPLRALQSWLSVLVAWAVIWLARFPRPLGPALYLFAAILPLVALQQPAAVFQVFLRAEYPALIGIFNRCAGFLLLMAVVSAGGGLLSMVLVLLASESASLLVTLRYAGRFVRLGWRWDPERGRAVLRSSVPLGLATLFTALINRADFIMLERMTTLDQVGLYAAAYKVSNLLETFPIMVMATVYPLMCRYAREDMGRLRELYRKSVVSLGVVAVPLAVGVTLLAPTVVRILFGSEFAGAAPGLMVLIWSTVCVYVALGGGNLLISMRYERVNLALNVLGAAVNIALNLLLIPRMGITGAALATTVTYLVIAVGTLVGSYLALHPASAGPAMSAVLLRLRA